MQNDLLASGIASNTYISFVEDFISLSPGEKKSKVGCNAVETRNGIPRSQYRYCNVYTIYAKNMYKNL